MDKCQHQEKEILNDLNGKGKRVDWKGKKVASLKLARVYKDISDKIKNEYKERGVHMRYKKVKRAVKNEVGDITGIVLSDEPMGLYDKDGKRVVNYEKRAENMRFCGSILDFADMGDKLKLIRSNFCRTPLCVMCQWRKSMRIFFDVSAVMREVFKRYINCIPVFLTLTVRNCSINKLSETLNVIYNGWNEFMRSKTLNPEVRGEKRRIVQGWFRATEITYNDKTDEFHPHFHAVMLLDRSYFKSVDYMRTEEWVQLWRRSAKLNYDPVCDIRRTRTTKGKQKEVAEIAKYTYKDAEILNKKLSDDKKSEVVKYLSGALHGRRLYAYGGIMKDIAAELKIQDIDKTDLVKVDDDNIDSSLAKMILTYHWNMGISNYTLVKKTERNEKE